MDSNSAFNLTIFTDITKNICMCSAVSIAIIVFFIISPLSNFFKTALFMKIIALIIFCIPIYFTFFLFIYLFIFYFSQLL